VERPQGRIVTILSFSSCKRSSKERMLLLRT
jgi:hypothetical protein